MKFLFLTAFVLSSLLLFSQPSIRFLNTERDMGIISPGNMRPAVFKFVNNGNQPLAILMVRADYEVKSSFNRNYIAPGDTGRITLTYESARLGEFAKSLEVVTNAQTTTLNIRGKVGSAIECMPNRQNQNIRQILVLDKETKEPIAGAKCSMVYNGGQNLSATTNNDGTAQPEMKIGQYEFALNAPGYRPLQDARFVTRSMSMLVFEMDPLPRVAAAHPVAQQPTQQPIRPVAPQPQPEPVLQPDTSKNMPSNLYKPNNIVFLVDVSLSMKQDNKMGKLKKAMQELTEVLRPEDKVCLIAYNHKAFVVQPTVSGANKDSIVAAIDSLTPRGLTNGVQGLELAYEYAHKNFITTGNNELLLATDGEFTGSEQSESALVAMISNNAQQGILLSIVGFGFDSESIDRLKKMSQHGKGEYLHIYEKQDNTRLLIDAIKTHSFRGKSKAAK